MKQREESHSASLMAAIQERNGVIDSLKDEYTKQLDDCKLLQSKQLEEIQILRSEISSIQSSSSRREVDSQIRLVECMPS